MGSALRSRPRSALVLTGLQRNYCDPRGALAASGVDVTPLSSIVPQARALLGRARASGATVLHLVETTLPSGRSDSRVWRASKLRVAMTAPHDLEEEIVPELRAEVTDLVVERYRSGGFVDTRADVLLRSNRVGTIVLAGVETHAAVLATAIQGSGLDYDIVVAEDCVASRDRRLHDAALDLLRVWARVLPATSCGELFEAASEGRQTTGRGQ